MTELYGVTVLVVEDDDDTREVLKVMLEMCGARVVCAESARGGLQRFRQEHPQAIVSDIAMPELDGYAFIRQVRAAGTRTDRPLRAVAVTAHTGAEVWRRRGRLGAAAVAEIAAAWSDQAPAPVRR